MKRPKPSIPDYTIRTKYKKKCSICRRPAKWAFSIKGKRYGACSRKHLRRI